jgi:hypothetical protein
MTSSSPQPYAAFRLNLEQQKKRAKELLQAAKAGDSSALQRVQKIGDRSALTLAAAQHCLARELRFANWAALKAHILKMEQVRATLGGASRDADCHTMHIRCGDDIRQALITAGFAGDFNRHINPYLQGPVIAAPDWLEQRARFIIDSAQTAGASLTYDRVLQDLQAEEQRLAAASREYERVVLWLEHDRYDQFVLLRCLAWFAEHGAPPTLELIGPNDFPGATRFLGLGQLPPEALVVLWEQRKAISSQQLVFGHALWQAFRAPDPRPLAAWVRKGTPLLPDLAAALYRHLQDLPSVETGFGLTHQLLLTTLAEQSPVTAGKLIGIVMQRDPLPGLGDSGYEYELRLLERICGPLLLRKSAGIPGVWRHDMLEITERGRALLHGELRLTAEELPARWIGGVCCSAGQRNWHWDERQCVTVLR